MKLIFVFLFSFLGLDAFSKDSTCSDIDLRPSLGPARDQGISMWCYAHSAADLVSQKIGQRVSAFDLATTYLLADEQKVLSSRDPEIRLALIRDTQFAKRLLRWRLDEPESYDSAKILTEYGLYYLGGMDQDAILLSALRGYCKDINLPGSDELFKTYLTNIYDLALNKCGPGGIMNCSFKAPLRIGVIKDQNAKSLANVFQNWVDNKCGPRIKPTRKLTTKTYDVAESLVDYNKKLKSGELNQQFVLKKMMKIIDASLNSGKAVAIGYNLLDVSPSEQVLSKLTESLETEVDHSSVVAARRMVGGKCRYFVRTHLGNSCPYLDHVKLNCEPENGGLWVSPEEIPSLYSTIVIRD
jgi:hypothetical protein